MYVQTYKYNKYKCALHCTVRAYNVAKGKIPKMPCRICIHMAVIRMCIENISKQKTSGVCLIWLRQSSRTETLLGVFIFISATILDTRPLKDFTQKIIFFITHFIRCRVLHVYTVDTDKSNILWPKIILLLITPFVLLTGEFINVLDVTDAYGFPRRTFTHYNILHYTYRRTGTYHQRMRMPNSTEIFFYKKKNCFSENVWKKTNIMIRRLHIFKLV